MIKLPKKQANALNLRLCSVSISSILKKPRAPEMPVWMMQPLVAPSTQTSHLSSWPQLHCLLEPAGSWLLLGDLGWLSESSCLNTPCAINSWSLDLLASGGSGLPKPSSIVQAGPQEERHGTVMWTTVIGSFGHGALCGETMDDRFKSHWWLKKIHVQRQYD